MSALKDLVGGADCSGGNSLSHFTKQLQQDRSLQQDRFGPPDNVGVSSSGLGMRGRAARPNLATDSVDEFINAPGPQGMQRPGMFDMQPLGRELDSLIPLANASRNAGADWGAEFVNHNMQMGQRPMALPQQNGIIHGANWINEFESSRQSGPLMREPVARDMWAAEFHSQKDRQHPQMINGNSAELERAFEQARYHTRWEPQGIAQRPEAWASEYQGVENANAESWIKEFKETEGMSHPEGSKEALAESARMLLDAVNAQDNPKFRDSQFMKLMKQFRDQEASIEGNKVVEQTTPFEEAESWAKEFGGGTPMQKASWEEDFNALQSDVPNTAGKSKMWAEEFAGGAEADWATEYQGNGPKLEDKQWTDEFQRQAQEQAWANEFASGDSSLAEAFADESKNLDDLYNNAWDYDDRGFSDVITGRAIGARYDHYEFTSNNPFVDQVPSPVNARNLTETILVLEAAVQKDATNSRAWYELGIRQQENENDVAAIAALREAVRHDPGLLDSWIALSVSYTNENARADAYDALESWIANNPKYSHIAARSREDTSPHETIANMYIEAARQGGAQELDADVQVGLGVLFNISEEYQKAVDCFEAALSKRPQDYLLWNKLGATLANSNDSERAMDAYFHALDINPSYVRARYNLAISCIQLQQYREAAEHLLGALAVQSSNIETVVAQSKGKGRADEGDLTAMHSVQSGTVWSTLKMVADGHLRRHDLAEACEKRDLDAFRGEFVF
ncbi:uncharacterized protein EV422DRAFT_241169 [Fimicolochytrium jonesii]|uniref:uncharacterized protein n=1 Tax=Fimicolochytrium jonesii TaxID=1396493 RepID=UPI0022FE177B|nr:uncharacterized protein EV422DRAFT_241169 [Fimicolochytrium jonesii]KAI8825004.1 hypothetical protein EV422DRAFT_241169 [Fimicolochytrium jonesii]